MFKDLWLKSLIFHLGAHRPVSLNFGKYLVRPFEPNSAGMNISRYNSCHSKWECCVCHVTEFHIRFNLIWKCLSGFISVFTDAIWFQQFWKYQTVWNTELWQISRIFPLMCVNNVAISGHSTSRISTNQKNTSSFSPKQRHDMSKIRHLELDPFQQVIQELYLNLWSLTLSTNRLYWWSP